MKKTLKIFSFILLSALILSGCNNINDNTEEIYQNAKTHIAEENHSQAIKELEQIKNYKDSNELLLKQKEIIAKQEKDDSEKSNLSLSKEKSNLEKLKNEAKNTSDSLKDDKNEMSEKIQDFKNKMDKLSKDSKGLEKPNISTSTKLDTKDLPDISKVKDKMDSVDFESIKESASDATRDLKDNLKDLDDAILNGGK